MESSGSLLSLDVYDWVSDLKQINLNEVHKSRRCELLLVAEKSLAASARLKMIERNHHANRTGDVHIVTLSDVYDFVENRPTALDKSTKRIADAACREALRYSRACDPIPIDLLVTLIKLKIISIIEENVRDAQRGVVFDKTRRILEDLAPVASTKSKKAPVKNKGKKATIQEDVCWPYLIPKVEEGDYESTSIPDKLLYVVLMGFYMGNILEQLLAFGMTLACVIEICEKATLHSSSSIAPEIRHLLAHKHYNSRLFRNKHDTLCTFWNSLYDCFFRNKNPQVSNSFIVLYTPMITLKNPTGGSVANTQEMFEHFVEAVRKLEEYRRWHGNYLGKLRVFGLGEAPEMIPARCMGAHNEVLDDLPNDCIDAGVVLEALLGEVCQRLDGFGPRKSPEFQTPTREKRSDFRGQLKKLLAHSRAEPKVLQSQIKSRTRVVHGCYNLSLLDTFRAHLKMNTLAKLWERYPSTPKTISDVADFNRQLKELDNEDLVACIGVFLFGKIGCASSEDGSGEAAEMEKCFPNRNNDVKAMLKPEPEVTDCKQQSLTNVYEQLLLGNLAWIEDLPSVVFLQVLNEAAAEFECADHIYVPALDSIFFRFHHNADAFGIKTSEWSETIRSPVDLNDFFAFVVHEDGEFVLSEQRRREELGRLYQEIVEKEMCRLNLVEISDEDFIVKGSIKEQARRAGLQVGEQEKRKKEKEKRRGKSEKPKKDAKKSKAVSGKKPAAPMDLGAIVEDSEDPIQVNMQDVEDAFNVKFPPEHLDAYDFEKRTAIMGSTTTFHSLDPMKVTVSRYMLAGKPPRTSINLTINNHTMIIHAYVLEGFAFNFILKNGTAIAFGRETKGNYQENQQNMYLLKEKRIHSLKCVNQNLVLKRKLLVKAQYLQRIINAIERTGRDEGQQAASFVKPEFDGEDLKISRKDFLRELKQLKISKPSFKICSTRLHKYTQVKRLPSPLPIQLQHLRKFFNCKNNCHQKRLLQVKECLPIPDVSKLLEPDYDVRITLGNTLHIRSIPGATPNSYHINQFFVSKAHLDIAAEQSRTFLRWGCIVVKHLDGTLTLYTGDGRVVKFDVPLLAKHRKNLGFQRKGFLKIVKRRLTRLERNARYSKSRRRYGCVPKQVRYNLGLLLVPLTDANGLSFIVIAADGKRVGFKKGKVFVNDCHYVFWQSDIRESKYVGRREDGTQIILTQDGHIQTTHVDGTRITSWFEVGSRTISFDLKGQFGAEAEDMGAWVIVDVFYQFEHPHYVTVTCSSTTDFMKLQMPEGVALEHEGGGGYVLRMDAWTTAKISKDTIQVQSLPCMECKRQCWCTFNITQLYQLHRHISGEDTLLVASDTYNKTLIVNYDGKCSRNDSYDSSETNCNHFLHKKQSTQAFLIMRRDHSGQLMWTDQMYQDRLVESQLAPNQTAIFYTDEATSTIQTAEFRSYEKKDYHDRFTMTPYLPTIIRHYKEPPFDFDSATLATQTLLRKIPDFQKYSPLHMILAKHLLPACKFDLLATNTVSLDYPKNETTPVPAKTTREVFTKKIAEWKRQCKLGRQAVMDFHSKPFYDFAEEPSDHMKTSKSQISLAMQEEPSFRTIGTNTLIPFCFDTETEAPQKQPEEEGAGMFSIPPIPPAQDDNVTDDRYTPEVLKNKLLDCICDILQNNYGIAVDGDTSVTPEEQPETPKSERSESADASSVPEFLKGDTYRAFHKLFASRSGKETRGQPLKSVASEDSIATQADSWVSPSQDYVAPIERTLSMKVLSSRVMYHPSYSDAELILKVKSSEVGKVRQEKVDGREGETSGVFLRDFSSTQHHCRDCLDAPFVTQGGSLYERQNFLD